VGMDTGAGVGSVLHQEASDLGMAVGDGEVDGAMLVPVGDLHISELGACLEHGADEIDVANFHGFDESLDCDAVDVSLEFGPAIEAVAAGKDELRVVQGEGLGPRAVVLLVDFADGYRVARFEGAE